MIGRQGPVREFLPLSGGSLLGYHALRAALLSPARRVLLCGGEERGTWLLEHGLASDRTFAFAVDLGAAGERGAAGHARLSPAPGEGSLSLAGLFDLLRDKAPYCGCAAPGWSLELAWH
jgi:hypothetical protein